MDDILALASIRRFAIVASLAFVATSAAPYRVRHEPSPVPATTIEDSLRILYIGRPAGWEHYELSPSDGGMKLTSDYDWVDRGKRNHTQLTLTTGKDYALKTFETVRVTVTSRTVKASVDIDGARAKLTRNGTAVDVPVPDVAFAVSSYYPTAQHLALIRYWQSLGSPKTIA